MHVNEVTQNGELLGAVNCFTAPPALLWSVSLVQKVRTVRAFVVGEELGIFSLIENKFP